MFPQGAKPPDEGDAIVVGPGNVAAFYQVCEDILKLTDEICRIIWERSVDMDLSELIRETSHRLWDELQMIPPVFLLLVNHLVGEYSHILIDLQSVIQLNSLDDCSRLKSTQRINTFTNDFKRKMSDIRSSSYVGATFSSSLFANAKNTSIFGGTFNVTTGNMDPTLRVQMDQLLRMQYANLGVLFVSAGHKWLY